MLIFKPIKRIFPPENLENSRGGGKFASKKLNCLKTAKNSI